MSKRKVVIITIILLLITFGVIAEKDVIFQEGNPVKMMIGITKLLTGESIVRI